MCVSVCVCVCDFGSLSNATMNNTNQTSSLGIVQLLDATPNEFLSFPLLLGLAAMLANALQLWFLETKFAMEINSLIVMIRFLCITDMLNGGIKMINIILIILERTVFQGSIALMQIINIVGLTTNKYVFVVSTVMLDCLTVLKMSKVTDATGCEHTQMFK